MPNAAPGPHRSVYALPQSGDLPKKKSIRATINKTKKNNNTNTSIGHVGNRTMNYLITLKALIFKEENWITFKTFSACYTKTCAFITAHFG